MTEHIAELAPDSLPIAEYSRVNEEQTAHIRAAMKDPENHLKFEVELLPLDTAEQRQAAAVEWAACKQAIGEVKAREMGAFAVLSTRDESPEALLRLLEDRDDDNGFVTHALLRVVKKAPEARTLDLLRTYYGLE